MTKLNSAARLRVFRDALLEHDEDPALQALTDEACAKFETPISLVSFVMGATQFFRAARGLPPDLQVSLATSRCDSFCQYVVEDEKVLAVSDTDDSPHLPKRLVDTYGIRAYLGAPIRVDGHVLGSFCVIDVVAREFTETQQREIQAFADRASARLSELVEQKTAREEVDVAHEVAVLDRALAELAPIFRLAGALAREELSSEEAARGLSVLTELESIFPEVRARLRKVRRAVQETP